MSRLYPAIRVFVLGAGLTGLVHAGGVFDRVLPNSTNVNGSPATRSNEAWVTGFFSNAPGTPPVYQLVGDDFTPNFSGIVSSLTVYEVANNNIGDGASAVPTSEFSTITLYEGTSAAAMAGGISAVSSAYSFSQAFYQPGSVNFIDQNGFSFPIYALTFGGLNLPVVAGTTYDFALDATAKAGGCANSPFGDPCFLALHGTNAALAGTGPQDGANNQFINFKLAGGLATVQGSCNAACQASTASVPAMAGTDINILINPEPGTWATLAGGLASLILVARKRRGAK